MTEARDQILTGIRRALKRGPVTGEALAAVEARLTGHPRNLIPERTRLARDGLLRLFEAMAVEVAATVARVVALGEVPDAIAAYLALNRLPARVRVAPDPLLAGIDWARRPALEVGRGKATEDDPVSVTAALAGIAETGTLMLASGPDSPTTLNFLPDTHIVVLPTGRVVGPYEDAWDLLRRRGPLPRTVNLITGPSRTGDIEQTIQLGAHGPRRLHIVLVESADA